MGSLLKDLRYGARMLVRAPGFTIVAVLTLALGIGANTAIFTVVDAVLLRPLPYPNPDQLVMVWDTQPELGAAPASYPEYLDWKEQLPSFEELAAWFGTGYTLTREGDPERISGLRVSANLAGMLGIVPALGRAFLPEEEARGGQLVAMVSHPFWQGRLGGDPTVVGRTLSLGGESHQVVGVLPRGLRFGDSEVWVPLRLDTEVAPRGMHFITVMGRLKHGTGLDRAHAETEVLASRLRGDAGSPITNHGIKLVSLHEDVVGQARPTLLLLLGAVGFVLLIGCTNVANLLLARSASRGKEIAIRLAVGAGRARLVRQLLTESLLLALIGGGLGLLLAAWGVEGLSTLAAGNLPRASEIGVDSTVLTFSLGVSLLTGLLFGLAPAWHLTSPDLHESLKEGRLSGLASARGRMGHVLVGAEVALSLILLIGAGLLLRSFARVTASEKGYRPDHVLTMEVDLTPSRYSQQPQYVAFVDQLLEGLRSLPGVEASGAISHLPLSDSSTNGGFLIEGSTWPEGKEPLADLRVATDGYFQAMGIAVLSGRDFDRSDRGGRRVAIVSEEMARRFLPGENPLGRRIDPQWGTDGWHEIIGVVGDVKHEGLDRPMAPAIYLPYHQRTGPWYGMTMVIRAADDPLALAGAARAQVIALDSEQPVSSVASMPEFVSRSLAPRWLTLSLVGLFAACAMALAALGIYGVLALSVTQRAHEIGIRMALGAGRRDVLRLVVGQGMRMVLVGLGVGLAAAFGLTRILRSLLYEVTPTDPITFVGIPALLAGVALLASYLPARRAVRVDPLAVLRQE